MYPLLDTIHSPEDLRRLSDPETIKLAEEIRGFLVDNVSQTGGHLSANLGAVELTLALHRCFHTPEDKIVFDVGHQSYTHKILTGRKERFSTLRQEGGLSGFPKSEESVHDAFNTGHASTSISAALGLAEARDLAGEDHYVVAVIGDGALTGGLCYEAMNQAGRMKTQLLVVLNDNQMSIGPNVGALARALGRMRTRRSYLKMKQAMHLFLDHDDAQSFLTRRIRRMKQRIKYFLLMGPLFEELGFTYLGPIDGNDLRETEEALRQAKNIEGPVLLHVKTVKGKGYKPAEKDAAGFHGVGRFDPHKGRSGLPCGEWAASAGEEITRMAERDPKIVAITAAMPQGTGLEPFADRFPERMYDVGIAEEHAVTFSAGLAKGGAHPWFFVYSSFLQRAYDEILHDVCLQHLPVHLMLDHAGIVGNDGETHQGVFDIAFLGSIPGMLEAAPSGKEELRLLMHYMADVNGPTALRYPKGDFAGDAAVNVHPSIVCGEGYLAKEPAGAKYLILSLGPCLADACKAAQILEQEGIPTAVADARFCTGLSAGWYREIAKRYGRILTVEDGVHTDGYGVRVRDLLAEQYAAGRKDGQEEAAQVRILALPDRYIEQGNRADLLRKYGISADGIVRMIRQWDAEKHGTEKD